MKTNSDNLKECIERCQLLLDKKQELECNISRSKEDTPENEAEFDSSMIYDNEMDIENDEDELINFMKDFINTYQ